MRVPRRAPVRTRLVLAAVLAAAAAALGGCYVAPLRPVAAVVVRPVPRACWHAGWWGPWGWHPGHWGACR